MSENAISGSGVSNWRPHFALGKNDIFDNFHIRFHFWCWRVVSSCYECKACVFKVVHCFFIAFSLLFHCFFIAFSLLFHYFFIVFCHCFFVIAFLSFFFFHCLFFGLFFIVFFFFHCRRGLGQNSSICVPSLEDSVDSWVLLMKTGRKIAFIEWGKPWHFFCWS